METQTWLSRHNKFILADIYMCMFYVYLPNPLVTKITLS